MSNEIVAFFKGRTGVAESVYQYDYGKVLVIDGLNLPSVFEAHFANTGDDNSTTVIGQNNRIAIPNSCLLKTGIVTVYIYLHTGENDGEVEYIVRFAVTQRARPAYDSTDDERTEWETAAAMAIAMLQNSKKVNNPLDAYNQVIYGTAGQILRTKGDGSTEWSDVGLPTDAQTAAAVAAWLNIHPEATTTVEDGSLTDAKFSSTLKLKTIKEYITPEMFGAKGDGTTDDTVALQACIQSGKIALLTGTYKITSALDFDGIHDFEMHGGKIVRPSNQTFNTICGEGCKNVHFENIVFDGNGNSRDSAYSWKDNVQACIILASQSKEIYIEKCEILNHNYGIFILGADVEDAPTTYDNTSMNGVIRDCVFHNCHSAIDTYGKATLIDHNVFYDITENAIQIEPNYQMDPDTPNPLNDSTYYTSAVNSAIINNMLINISRCGILVHKNVYGCLVKGNTIIDFEQGISISNSALKGVFIAENTLLYQKPQTVDSDKRPWNYLPAISIRGKNSVINNFLWKAVTGIHTTCGNTIIGNVIDSPVVSAITMQLDINFRDVPTLIAENTVINHIKNTSAWWGATAFCFDYTGNSVAIIDNIVQSDVEPLHVGSGQKAYVENLVSTVQQSTAITASDYKTYSNHS